MLRKYIDFELLLSYKTPKSIKTAQSPVLIGLWASFSNIK